MLQEIKEETDINPDWQNLERVILAAATQFKSAKGLRNTNNWWDDECKRAILEKNEARGKCLIRKTRDLDIYQKIKANRICRRKKKEWTERKIKGINETNMKEDTRKFYRDVIKLTNPYITATLVCKDKDQCFPTFSTSRYP
jgi:hypothetical protein